MAEIINMPRLSDTMEEGTVVSWLKKVGDQIVEGDILAEIETDKATMEFESFHEGILLHIGVQEGETTKVDELLAIIGEKGEDISELLNRNTSEDSKTIKEDVTLSSVDESKESKEKVELPEGVIIVTMPRLSDTMEEGTVAAWLKKVGDEIVEGDILAEIETDKATMEFESFNEGTLLYIGLQEGDTAKVDALLVIIGPKGTDVSAIVKNFKVDSDVSKTEVTQDLKMDAPKS
ncbi:pyruvate dehydrogenase, partial [Flavobacteriaceae bacterium PRS1]